MPSRSASAVLLLLGILGCQRERPAGLLSFIAERDGNREVYLLDLRDLTQRRLTRSPAADYNGPGAPDGSALLVTTVAGEGEAQRQQLFRYSLAGGEPVALSPATGRVRHPSWSKDGAWVFFEADLQGYSDIYRAAQRGAGLQRLTRDPEGSFEPALGASGDSITYVSSRDGVAELYRMDLAGQATARLTHTARDEWSPRPSPDGARLVFASDREGADRLYLMNADGSEVRRLSREGLDPAVVEEAPAWAPGGERLAYVRRRGSEPGRVFVVALAGGDPVAMAGEGDQGEPAWSLDGRYLALSVRHGGASQIYLVRADGSGGRWLTAEAGGNWHPLWVY